MKNIIWVVLIIGVLVLGAYLYLPKSKSTSGKPVSSTSLAKNTIVIKDFAFSPSELSVKVGDTVSWVNEDLAGHSATSDGVTFDTGVFEQNDTKTVTFDKAGTYTYHCTAHPNMKGKIVVE